MHLQAVPACAHHHGAGGVPFRKVHPGGAFGTVARQTVRRRVGCCCRFGVYVTGRFCHRRLCHVHAAFGRNSGGMDPQKVRGRPRLRHEPAGGQRLAAGKRHRGADENHRCEAGGPYRDPHRRHDPAGRPSGGGRGHGEPVLPHRRVHARGEAPRQSRLCRDGGGGGRVCHLRGEIVRQRAV